MTQTHFKISDFDLDKARRLAATLALMAIVSTRPAAADRCAAATPEPQADHFAFTTLQPAMLDVLGNDSHNLGLPMSLSVDAVQTPQGGTLELNPDATFTYRRAPGYYSEFRFTYRVSDGSTSRSGIPVTVNFFPDIINLPAAHRPDARDDTVIVPAGSAAHAIAAADLLANDTDLDPGDTAALIIDPASLGAPLRGSVQVDTVDPASGGVVQLTYLPGADFFAVGWDELTYRAVDPSGLAGTATVLLFAEGWNGPPNSPPTAIDHTFEIPQATRTFIPFSSLLDGSSDPDGDWLTVIVLSRPDPAVTHQWRVEEGGVVWKPRIQPPFIGAATFTYQVSDGTDVSAPATVTLDVKVITDPPTAGYDGPFTVPKHGRLFIHFENPGGGEPNIFGNDRSRIPDAPLVPIQLAFDEPAHGRLDFCCDPRGFWYIPEDGYAGADSFWYTVADINFRSVTAKVTLDVRHLGGPDPPPTLALHDFLQATPLGETAMLWSDLLANDQGTNLRFSTLIPEQVNPLILPHGEIEVFSPGYEYGGPEVPPAGYDGALLYRNLEVPASPAEDDSIDYRIIRPDDLSSGRATLGLAVDPFGNYIAYNDLIVTAEGRAVNSWYNRLLANDVLSAVPGADPYVDPVFLSRPRVGEFTHLTGVGGVTYRPPPGFVGVDSFTYRVVDRNLLAPDLVARVVIVVEPGAPLPQPDHATTYQGLAVAIDALANDGDPHGDPLHLTAVEQPADGQAIIEPNASGGRIVYTPAAGFVGSATFRYTVADADGNEASSTVAVEVLANLPPVAVAEVFCDGLHCRFDAGSSTDDLGIASYVWQLGSGPGAEGREGVEVLVDLPAAGDYQLTLGVTDVGWRSSQTTVAFSADPQQPGGRPIAAFTYSCPQAPTCIFDASPSVDDVEIILYQWDFGDLTRPIGKITEFAFPAPDGGYQVTLAVRDSSGQIDTHTVTVTPLAAP